MGRINVCLKIVLYIRQQLYSLDVGVSGTAFGLTALVTPSGIKKEKEIL